MGKEQADKKASKEKKMLEYERARKKGQKDWELN